MRGVVFHAIVREEGQSAYVEKMIQDFIKRPVRIRNGIAIGPPLPKRERILQHRILKRLLNG